MFRRTFLFSLILFTGVLSSFSHSAEQARLLPQEVTLTGAAASQRLILQEVVGGEVSHQIHENIKYRSSDEKVVRVEEDTLYPVSNGKATLTATSGHLTSTLTVQVTGMDQEHSWSFNRHIQSVLTKAGCNSGACHGALAGKGGFRLSLRGYDSASDHHTITQQARGRRIELSDPGRSLLIAKPTGALPHKGGVRFETNSQEYRILSEWIARGASKPSDEEPQLDHLEIYPERALLTPGDRQQLLVQAHYSDGSVDDVTHWAKYVSANEAVAQVAESGEVSVTGFGEGAVTAIFNSQIVISRITSPYDNAVSDELFTKSPRNNFVDELVLKQLRRLNLPPSPPASDQVFLRRVYLDTIGTLPTIDEIQAFENDNTPDKRNRIIDSLLSRPEFVDYWAYKWSDILLLNGNLLRPKALQTYYEWIRGHVQNNTPWDEFVREILTAQGSSIENGATNFYALHQEPEQMAENACQAFLGLSIGCAKCHNHPLEKWTNDQYYALGNLFARVRAKGWGGEGRNGDGVRTLFVASKGDLIQPLTGKPQPPTPLDGIPLSFESSEDRRIHLANWMTSPENKLFSRAITNRIWANFMGVGLVEQVDDLRTSNPASNEELLEALSGHLVKNDFNLKELMRTILQSETYQRSSEVLPGNKEENRFYSRYYPRRLMAEVLLDAISQVTGTPSVFDEMEFSGADKVKLTDYPVGTRALQLRDAAVTSYFLKTFGRNERMITCECERTEEPSMVQVLHLSNGTTINEKLRGEESCVVQFLKKPESYRELLDKAFLSSLARRPTEQEVTQLLPFLENASEEEKQPVIEDLYWSLLTSREFLFNH